MKRFIVDAVVNAGGNPCPPTIVGVGIGGNADKAMLLSKVALRREAGAPNPDPHTPELERDLLREIIKSGVGPQGFGGRNTAARGADRDVPHPHRHDARGRHAQLHAARHKEVVL